MCQCQACSSIFLLVGSSAPETASGSYQSSWGQCRDLAHRAHPVGSWRSRSRTRCCLNRRTMSSGEVVRSSGICWAERSHRILVGSRFMMGRAYPTCTGYSSSQFWTYKVDLWPITVSMDLWILCTLSFHWVLTPAIRISQRLKLYQTILSLKFRPRTDCESTISLCRSDSNPQ